MVAAPSPADPSPLLAAMLALGGQLPAQLREFDALVRGAPDGPAPSFEEYSARVGEALLPWRETCYFDVAGDPLLVSVANTRFAALARALEVAVPPAFLAALDAGASAGPEVLQIVLGIDATPGRLRLKYYLIYRDRSARSVGALHAALALPSLPPALDANRVYILGIDFRPRELSDFKLYVRLDAARVPRVIRNLRAFEGLWRGSRYVVFQHCLLSGGRQVYFHASSAELLEQWLSERARREPAVRQFISTQLPAMNAALTARGHAQRLRPWIASLPYREGALLPAPSNVYFHFSDESEPT